jgi:hypothetical protein
MLRKILANKMARKSLVFAITFVVAAASLGTAMLGNWDADAQNALGQATRGDVEEYSLQKPVFAQTRMPEQEMPGLVFAYADAIFRMSDEHPESAPAAPIQQILYYSPPGYRSAANEEFRLLPCIPLCDDLQRYTYTKSQEIGFDYTLALAIMWSESNFRVGAVGHNSNGTSDSGIMQINDVNREWLYRDLGINDLFNPYQNIDAGMEILRRLNEKHGQHNAVIAYQMGESGMLRLLESGRTTSSYTERLYRKQRELQERFAALED